MNHNRRNFITALGLAPLGISVMVRAADSSAGANCTDPASLSFSQKNRRRSLGYVEPSNDNTKNCGKCSFFTAAPSPASPTSCGTCQMLSGAPVSGSAVCDSFAMKATK